MDENKVPQSDDEILGVYADLLDQIILEDPDEISELLDEAGIDREKFRRNITALVDELKATTPLDWRNQQVEMEETQAKFQKAALSLPTDRESLMDMFRSLTRQVFEQKIATGALYHNRNKNAEEMSDDELKSVVQDLFFLLDDTDGNTSEE